MHLWRGQKRQTITDNHAEIGKKLDDITTRLDGFETRIAKLEQDTHQNENSIGELGAQVETSNELTTKKFVELTKRVADLEEMLEKLQTMPEDVRELSEKVEDRTNRQLRETLVFKNIPEVRNGDETYKDTKELLATTISEHCVDVSYDDALSQIKRAHRESGRRRDDEEEHPRVGKRIIYAAFHSWDMCQLIIETFREKCIKQRDFEICAEQKYGPKTNKRRQLAFKLRKQLKDGGQITSGFVDFPAKLMVNYPGQTIADGNGRHKKVYRLHTNFSKHDV